ncbi:c-type cytochrome [Oleiharenicola lentus]|uniref:C-type cytochrome n=1 Tax=Oleiharenicola lentus TaxID=2508720 RepID=A0A4Q1CCR5_9BACT|nr:PQQ-dependent sugar dehydrogenase [Oleiharenicola lentus]RXK56868.1 c-type cytochrome [Oleiharenicola lentus]
MPLTPRSVLALGCVLAGNAIFAAPVPFARLSLEKTTLEIATVAGDLSAPFDLAWGPDNQLWLTQLDGRVWRLNPDTGERTPVHDLSGRIFHRRSHGLLTLTFHPWFATAPYVYLHYVYQEPTQGAQEIVRSRVVRCRWDGTRLGEPETIFDAIPGASYHNGSRLAFGPDGKLYVSTGDVGDPPASLDPARLSGKILRLNPDGTTPADNPFPGSPVWTLGHRNAQGLAFSPDGRTYLSDHGANNDDEINLLQPGRNYGWPAIEGFIDRPHEIAAAKQQTITEPLRAWTPTIAVAGLAYYNHAAVPEWRGRLLLANLKGRALRVLPLSATGDAIAGERIFLQERLGRIRQVCVTPNGDIYLLTSNTDWHPRFQPWMYSGLPTGPDRIVRLRAVSKPIPAALRELPEWREDPEPLSLKSEDWSLPPTTEALRAGQQLYAQHCLPCHGPEGQGAPGLIPPLTKTDWVKNKNRLLQVALNGLSGRIEVNGEFYQQEMPAFRHLSDDDLSALLTYVRASFENESNAVTPAEVAEERKGLK